MPAGFPVPFHVPFALEGPTPTPGPFPKLARTTAGSPFTYRAFDLATMAPLDSLPYQGVSFGQQINTPGPWLGQLLLTDPRLKDKDVLASSRTGRTALFVDFLGQLVWGGIINTRRYAESGRAIVVGAQEFGAYFQQRLQAADYTATFAGGEDPMKIAKRVVEEALAVPAGNICGGIELALSPSSGSGQSVVESYPATQLQTIDQIVSTLSQLGYTVGFDYGFSSSYLPGTKTPRVTLTFYYPRQGRTADQSGLTVHAKDLIDWSYDEDSSKQANDISLTGSGEGGMKPEEAEAANVIAAGYPRLQAAVSYPQVNTQAALSDIALGALSTLSWPVVTPSLTLPLGLPNSAGQLDTTKITFSDFELGDDLVWTIYKVAGDGLNSSPRFPNGMDFEWRIIGWSCQVADAGESRLIFDLALPPVSPANVLAPAPPLE